MVYQNQLGTAVVIVLHYKLYKVIVGYVNFLLELYFQSQA